MIDRQHGKLVIECDSCSATFERDSDEWSLDVWRAAKAEGWKAKKIGKEWVHACQNCDVE